MLKIKRERLDELEKFGFELMEDGLSRYYRKEIDLGVWCLVFEYDRCFSIRFLLDLGGALDFSDVEMDVDSELDVLYDLIKNDMVEKEE